MSLSAQTLKGHIVNSKGEPVQNATIYIREVSLGIVADEQGDFLSPLKKGNYTAEVSALGFEKKIIPFEVLANGATLRIELKEKSYALQEVTVRPGDEDPAYAIMRKAIAKAPFFQYQVKSYLADIYLKGTFKIEKFPALLSISLNRKKIKNVVNRLFLIESQNEVRFTAPNHYDQKVIAMSSTMPIKLDDNMAMGLITSSIYSPDVNGFVSPLAPNAFTYYKFVWGGIVTEGNHVVNKIRIIPKKKDGRLMRGWIYIVDNVWNVQHISFTISQAGVTLDSNISCHEVRPEVFLPTAYDFKMNVGTMGVKAGGKYYSAVQYKKVEVNTSTLYAQKKSTVKEPTKNNAAAPNKKQLKKQQQLEQLMQKENLSNRDAYKMARLMSEAQKTKTPKSKSLEIQSDDSLVHVTHDSLAFKRDSSYWTEIRQMPLRPEEQLSYHIYDSLKVTKDSLLFEDSGQNTVTVSLGAKDSSAVGKVFNSALGGRTFHIGKDVYLGFDGLRSVAREYNFVDGFWLGQRFTFGVDFSKSKSLVLHPSVYYTTARETVNWMLEGKYKYAPMKSGEISFSGGNTTADFSGLQGDNRLINSVASLLFADNRVKLYQKKFFDISNKVDLANAFRMKTQLTYEKRNALENNTSHSLFGGSPKSNLPHGQLVPMLDNTALTASIGFAYTPRYYYRLASGRKYYDHSDFPTFSISYSKGFPVGNGNQVQFDKVEASINQSIKVDLFNTIDYNVNGGLFPTSKKMYLPDYKHFITNEIPVTSHSFNTNYSLLDNYRYATNDKWLQMHLNLTSDFLLLKRLPFLQGYLFDEALHLRSLWIPQHNYSEGGYSIGLGGLGRVGVFVGFDDWKYDAVGVSVSISLF